MVKKRPKWRFYNFFYHSSEFWCAKFKSYVHFCLPGPENLDNPKKNTDNLTSIIRKKHIFPDYREYQISRQGFLEAGCDGTRSAPSALHFLPRCLQSALSRRPKLRFGLEILINATLFAAGVNNTLELINN